MGAFIYFIPNRPAVSEKDVLDLGLPPVLGDGTPPCHGGRGPGGQDGVFCWADGTPEKRADDTKYARHDAAAQTWKKCAGGKYWIGYWNDSKPGPQDLARKEAVGGHIVTLEDGSQWLIPLARMMGGGTAFATKLDLNDDGEWIAGGVDDRFADLCDRAEDVFALVMHDWKEMAKKAGADSEDDSDDDTAPELKNADLFQLASDALCINYRVNKWEASALGLLTDKNAGMVMGANNILGALIDMPSIMDAVKKNADLDSTAAGEGD